MIGNNKQNPYLSAVFFTRNDGYGGKRHEAGIKGLLLQAEKHHLRLELIMVEWNPPPGKPLLKDVFPWPQNLNFCTIKTIVVPASIHARYKFSDKYPVHGTVSFNAGIRRARGEFVLSTTPDILFSDEIIEFLASEKLDKNTMYGINIHHVRGDAALRPTLEKQISYCQKAIRGVSDIGSPIDYISPEDPIIQREAPGDFILLPRERWNLIHGYPEIDVVGANTGDLVIHMAYLSGARDVILGEPLRVYHMAHETGRENRNKIIRSTEATYERFHLPKRLANILRYPLYKLFPPKNKLDEMGVTSLNYAEYRNIVVDMIKGKRSYIFNDENWGLGKETLEEFIISAAKWDKDYEKN
jgi:hypothetical protein